METNYRPISIVSNFAKIIEKIIYKRLNNFLEKFNILSQMQFGFRKGIGTNCALYYVTEYLYNNLDKSRPTIAVFLDLAKAFDTVNHKLLLEKLYYYGVRGTAYNLMKNYLSGRTQFVKIGKIKSKTCKINIGVPQGTILGPLLFLIYINSIFNLLPLFTTVSFADDTVILDEGSTWHSVSHSISNKIETVYNWLCENKLSLNIDKTFFMTFANQITSLPTNIELKLNNKSIIRSDCVKYLGIYYDQYLKWEYCITNIIKKTRFPLFIFAKLRRILSINSLMILYHGLFMGIASYGIIAWGSAYKNKLTPLLNLQKRILKIISKDKRNFINVPNLKQIYCLSCLLMNYRDLQNLYIKSTCLTRFRSIPLPKEELEVGKRSQIYTAIEIFNQLPNNLKLLNCRCFYYYTTILKEWITNLQIK